jgi:hypothetical protein
MDSSFSRSEIFKILRDVLNAGIRKKVAATNPALVVTIDNNPAKSLDSFCRVTTKL